MGAPVMSARASVLRRRHLRRAQRKPWREENPDKGRRASIGRLRSLLEEVLSLPVDNTPEGVEEVVQDVGEGEEDDTGRRRHGWRQRRRSRCGVGRVMRRRRPADPLSSPDHVPLSSVESMDEDGRRGALAGEEVEGGVGGQQQQQQQQLEEATACGVEEGEEEEEEDGLALYLPRDASQMRALVERLQTCVEADNLLRGGVREGPLHPTTWELMQRSLQTWLVPPTL